MADKIIETKEKILSALNGKFEVTKVEREYWDSGVRISCEFIIRGKRGSFGYDLEGVRVIISKLPFLNLRALKGGLN